jgi:hypothetical protein
MRRGALLSAGILLVSGFGAAPLAAQSAINLMVDECLAAGEEFRVTCEDAALALQALQGGVGLLAGAGGALPASPSTSGLRLVGSPRIIVDGGLSLARFRFPEPGRAVAGVRDEPKTLVGARLVGTVGVFDGFSPVATVGGVLGVDLVGSIRYNRLPSSVSIAGLRGGESSVWGWGGGVRLGVLRESFSLPGVTVTALHHRLGSFTHRAVVQEPGVATYFAESALTPRVTTVRAEVGKDLLALGVTLGAAWDRYSGEGRIGAWHADPAITPPPGGTSNPRDLTADRMLYFLGVNFTWVVLQAAGEIGWAGAPSRWTEFDGSGPTRTDARSLQGALTLRITY